MSLGPLCLCEYKCRREESFNDGVFGAAALPWTQQKAKDLREEGWLKGLRKCLTGQ